MDLSLGVAVYGALLASVALALVFVSRRVGRARAGAWLVTVGAVGSFGEDGGLLAWLAIASPDVDPHGVAGVAHDHVRAHMLGGAAWALVATGLVVWLAHARMRRGDVGAWWAVLAALVVGGGSDIAAYLALYSHGFPVGAVGGFGWPPVVASIVAWASGLALARRSSA